MEVFELQISLGGEWVKLAGFDDGCLSLAYLACERALMSEKTNARIIDDDGIVVYERFYNSQDDPDVNWRDEYDNESAPSVDWKREGF